MMTFMESQIPLKLVSDSFKIVTVKISFVTCKQPKAEQTYF